MDVETVDIVVEIKRQRHLNAHRREIPNLGFIERQLNIRANSSAVAILSCASTMV